MDILAGLRGTPSILLERVGRYDPAGPLSAAEEAGAWAAWKRVANSASPQQVVRTIADSGLRGRGGAGHPTADKWRACAALDAEQRFVVANGYEADPGAQLDRTLLERDPHGVLEGIALAAFAVGARRALVCVSSRAETAQRNLRRAIEAATEAGYLGPDALGSGFDLDVEVVALPGGFVVGEETVLLHAIENKRAQPDQRPPYPTRRGLWDAPTVVNNVETLLAVPWIMANGADAYAAIGAPDHPGTTLVQLSGAIARPGIAEVPTGTTVRRLVDEIGGGVRQGATLKAVLVGGPAGGFLPAAELDVAWTPAALEAAGAICGSGTIVAVDSTTCLVDMATLLERYLADEACGKTIPCRIGLRRLYEIGARATSGMSRPTDPQLLDELAADVRDGALCGLEYCAPNPLLTGMRYFGAEFDDHFARGHCPAGVCASAPVLSASR